MVPFGGDRDGRLKPRATTAQSLANRAGSGVPYPGALPEIVTPLDLQVPPAARSKIRSGSSFAAEDTCKVGSLHSARTTDHLRGRVHRDSTLRSPPRRYRAS